jgi:Pentapeptide repeats (8 copies)
MQRVHVYRTRPEPWVEMKGGIRRRWLVPLALIEWWLSWIAYGLSNWAFLEVLEYAGTFSVLVVVVLYFVERPDRIKQKHYQAWQVINTAQGKGGSGGRIEALEELNADRVPLVGVDAQGAFLMGLRLQRAPLARANFSGADLRDCHLRSADLNFATLAGANFRGCDLEASNIENADLSDADLTGADLSKARLGGSNLNNADLREANLDGVRWQNIEDVKNANVFHVRNAPADFLAWAANHGAVTSPPTEP